MNSLNHQPRQRDIWLFNPDPVKGNELGFKDRPALIVSNNLFNQGPSNMVIVVPCSSKNKNIPSHVLIKPPNGGVLKETYALCEQVRAISKIRLIKKIGSIEFDVLHSVLEWISDFFRMER